MAKAPAQAWPFVCAPPPRKWGEPCLAWVRGVERARPGGTPILPGPGLTAAQVKSLCRAQAAPAPPPLRLFYGQVWPWGTWKHDEAVDVWPDVVKRFAGDWADAVWPLVLHDNGGCVVAAHDASGALRVAEYDGRGQRRWGVRGLWHYVVGLVCTAMCKDEGDPLLRQQADGTLAFDHPAVCRHAGPID